VDQIPPLDAFSHLALSVRDIDASAAWYEDVLGFVELFREDGPSLRGRVFRFGAGGLALGLTQHLDHEDAGFDPTRTGLDHAAFRVDRPEDLDVWLARLTERGVEHSGLQEVPPGTFLNFKDPDGIALAFFCPRPGSG
jgi:glyoxylase I family protein